MTLGLTGTPAYFAERLWRIYDSEQQDSKFLSHIDHGRFIQSVLSPAQTYHAAMLDISNDRISIDAVRAFFHEVISRMPKLPAGWFNLFHEAAAGDVISRGAWGAAARAIYTKMNPKRRGRGASRGYLEGFRLADPEGTMLPPERALLASLPPTLTLYRGAVAGNLAEAVAGLNWTTSRNNAMLGIYRRRNGFYGPAGTSGRDYIIGAKVPRDAVLALIQPRWGQPVRSEDYGSLLVDFERIDLQAVENLPTTNLHLAILGNMLPNVTRLRSGFMA